MRNFLLRFSLFVLLFIVAGTLIKRSRPYGWGNPWYMDKCRALHALPARPDVFLFGSSRVYRQLIPVVFDSVMAAHGRPIRSYNLAAPGNFPPEAYHLLRGALRSGDIPRGSTVILDLMEPMPLEPHALRSPRSSYHMTFSSWWMMISHFLEVRSPRACWKPVWSSTLAYARNLFHIGQFRSILGLYERSVPELDGLDVQGFFSLEREVSDGILPELVASTRQRRAELLADTSVLTRQAAHAAKVRASAPARPPTAWFNALRQIGSDCAAHGVRLLWLMPPKALSAREWAMLHAIGPDRVIDLNDPGEFPEFYRLSDRFDRGHLNVRGARKLTVRLALRFLEFCPAGPPAQPPPAPPL